MGDTPDTAQRLADDVQEMDGILDRLRQSCVVRFDDRRPLIDHIDTLTARNAYLEPEYQRLQSELFGAALTIDALTARAEKAEAERDTLRAWLKTALGYIPTDTDDELDAFVREEITALLPPSPVKGGQ
jgi:hypothetical protein